MEDHLKKRDVKQARRMVPDSSVWWGFCERECMGHRSGDEPLTLTRWHSCEFQQLYEALERWKYVCGRAQNLKTKRGKFLYSYHLASLFFYFCSFHGMMHDEPCCGGNWLKYNKINKHILI